MIIQFGDMTYRENITSPAHLAKGCKTWIVAENIIPWEEM